LKIIITKRGRVITNSACSSSAKRITKFHVHMSQFKHIQPHKREECTIN